MNIEEITPHEIEGIITNISSAAQVQLRQFAARKKEEALIRELTASKKSDRERLVAYLERTTLDPIPVRADLVRYERTNQYLREQLQISPSKFMVLRRALEAADKIHVRTDYGRLMIYSFRHI